MSKTPKLRFKEFSGDWEEKKFKDLVLLQRGSSPRPISKYLTKSEEGVNWIKIGDVSKDSTIIYKTKEKITLEGAKKSRFVSKGDLILSNSMSFGRPYIMAIEGYIHDGWFVLKNYSKNFNRDYLCQLLTSSVIQKQYKRLAAGGVVDNISSEIVNSVEVNLPSKEEQEKIASFLSLVDDKISLQSEKVNALKDYKKGMIQKIFNRELRFKDDEGRDYPEWGEKNIRSMFTITRGVVIAKNEISYLKNDVNIYPVYSSQTSNDGILGYDCKYDFEGDYLTWTTDGANAGKVFRRSGKFRCTNVCGVLVENKETLGFANKMISEILNKETPKYVSYVGNPKLMNGVMGDISIKVPILEEQIKVSKILDCIDKKIEKEQEKLNLLNQYKKGLLQQMFV